MDGTPVRGRSGACVRAINADYSCVLGRDRNRAMAIRTVPVDAAVERAMTSPRPSCGGKSIIELIWDELMKEYEQALADAKALKNAEDHGNPLKDEHLLDIGQTRGRAQGFATAIAIITNPYAPNVDAIRQEAKERWENSSHS